MSKPRLIAFYLPQFMPTPENDEWWGKGFTEWTNVGRAKPLFRGHYQPRVPADLGYYDLRLSEVREQQAMLARNAGIEGFCYWHYWFNGKRLLDKVFTEVVESGKPDFPFCLCWANHSWYAKNWDPNRPDKLLIEQTYPGEQDYINHFYALLPAFKDSRYIRHEGKLLFGVFAPWDIPNFSLLKETWNSLARQNGLPDFYFFAFQMGTKGNALYEERGYDALALDVKNDLFEPRNIFIKGMKFLYRRLHVPYPVSYSSYVDYALSVFAKNTNVIPVLNPDFDHSPRSTYFGTVFRNSNPGTWRRLLQGVYDMVVNRRSSIVFIKAWNEWGEGNYLEPDIKWGSAYLKQVEDVYGIH